MSNRQNGWDDMRVRDRVSPREIAEGNKAELAQQQEEEELTPNDDQWIPPGNSDQGSRKK